MARTSAGARVPSAEGNGLEFEAKLSGVKPVMAKVNDYGSTSKGKLLVELEITQPAPPTVPYQYDDRQGGWKPRPKVAGGKDAEEKAKNLEREQAAFDEARAKFDKELEAFRPMALAYAQLVGLATVLGNQKLRVSMTAIESGMLPGFSAQLLPAPNEPGDED